MNQELYIRYVGSETDDSVIPFNELGESLIGFDRSIGRIAKILRVDCDVELRAKSTSDGSLVIDALLELAGTTAELFKNIDGYLEFAKLCGKEYWQEAVEYFNQIENTQCSLNDYFSKKPLDLALIGGSITYLLHILGKAGKDRKERPDEEVIESLKEEIGERVARELISLLKQKSLYKAIMPLIEETAKSIEVDTKKDFKSAVRIDQDNYQDYLTEDDRILPEYEDGKTYAFDGEITSIKSTRGDSMTFHTEIDGVSYNLELYPEDGNTTKSYLQYYQESVHLFAGVTRKSFYKKPKLKIYSIELNQKNLGLVDDDSDNQQNLEH